MCVCSFFWWSQTNVNVLDTHQVSKATTAAAAAVYEWIFCVVMQQQTSSPVTGYWSYSAPDQFQLQKPHNKTACNNLYSQHLNAFRFLFVCLCLCLLNHSFYLNQIITYTDHQTVINCNFNFNFLQFVFMFYIASISQNQSCSFCFKGNCLCLGVHYSF